MTLPGVLASFVFLLLVYAGLGWWAERVNRPVETRRRVDKFTCSMVDLVSLFRDTLVTFQEMESTFARIADAITLPPANCGVCGHNAANHYIGDVLVPCPECFCWNPQILPPIPAVSDA